MCEKYYIGQRLEGAASMDEAQGKYEGLLLDGRVCGIVDTGNYLDITLLSDYTDRVWHVYTSYEGETILACLAAGEPEIPTYGCYY
jgi:hypothetical protein